MNFFNYFFDLFQHTMEKMLPKVNDASKRKITITTSERSNKTPKNFLSTSEEEHIGETTRKRCRERKGEPSCFIK